MILHILACLDSENTEYLQETILTKCLYISRFLYQVTEENTSPVVQELSEYAIPSNDSQPAPRQPQHHSIPNRDHEYKNDRTSGAQPQSPNCELPQNREYEYPEQLPNHQYDYPDVRVVDGVYPPIVRPPLGKNESENSGNTSLINGQINREASATERKDQADRLLCVDVMDGDYTPLVRQPLKDNEAPCYQSLVNNGKETSEEASATERKDQADRLPYVDVMDGDYTPLVKQPLKDNEAPCYQSLVNNGRKTSEEASAAERKDQGNGLYDDVIDMNADYTPLARPPLKDNENEVPRYEPLLNNGQGSEEMNNGKETSEEASATERKDQADRLPYVDVMDGDYTPLGRQPLKDNEAPCYQSLVNNGRKTSEEPSATERKDQGNGLYDDVIDMNADYTPLARRPLKDNENEVPGYEPLLNNGQGSEEMNNGKETSEEASATERKDQADRLPYVDVMDGDYTPLGRQPLKDNEAPCYQSLVNNGRKTSEEASATERKDQGNGLYDDVIDMNGDYTPLARPPLKDNENEVPGYEPLLNNGQGSEEMNNGKETSEEASATERKDQADRLPYVDVMDGDYTPLGRQPLKDHEAPCYQSLVNNGRKTSEEASATERKDQGNGLYDDVIDMNGDYTPLARPPLQDNENEVPRYESLLNNGQGFDEMMTPMQRGREKIN